MNVSRVELKVCEGCGGLWLRTLGDGVYCRGCAAWLSEFPAPAYRGGRGKRRKTERAARLAGGAR
jgi:hypothetical protein